MNDTTRKDRGREETGRTQRIPMGVPRAKLHAEVKPGYFGYWFNDIHGRIQQAEQAGYTHVSEGKERRQVGVHPDGSPMFAYLMQIRMEFHDEDEAAKLSATNSTDAAIRRGTPREADDRDAANFYGQGSISS